MTGPGDEGADGPPVSSQRLLILRVGAQRCALPVKHVAEIMRPLPITGVPGTPAFVSGTAIIRGKITPVVDLRVVLDEASTPPPERLVLIRIGDARRVGALADAVEGVVTRSDLSEAELPPLLRNTKTSVVEGLTTLDRQLLSVLDAGAVLPVQLWNVSSLRGDAE